MNKYTPPIRRSGEQIIRTRNVKEFLKKYGYKWKKTFNFINDHDIAFYHILSPDESARLFGRFFKYHKSIGELYVADDMDHARIRIYDGDYEPYLFELLERFVKQYPMDYSYTKIGNK